MNELHAVAQQRSNSVLSCVSELKGEDIICLWAFRLELSIVSVRAGFDSEGKAEVGCAMSA